MGKSKVYFTSTITPEAMIQMYEKLGVALPGKVAVKLHSGEVGNQNFLRPDFMKPVIDLVKGTIVDILDEEGETVLEIPQGKRIQKNYVGSHMGNYDSMLVLSHFKGHPMGGFGGALKNISIGLASARGKAYIHGAGEEEKIWTADHDSFLESMADASKSIVDYYAGKIVFINVMKNMSVDCDCCAKAEDPAIADIGILASLDPVALDQACLDKVYASKDPGRAHLLERIESRNGVLIVEAAAALGIGSREYELMEL